jgi:hypothetical protein
MRFRKRTSARDDPALSAFASAASLIDGAQRALLAAIPTSRDPGIPLGEALDAFLEALNAAGAAMPPWRDERWADDWKACSDGIAEARDAARRLKNLKVSLTFEQLNAQIGDVLYPLDAFVDAERALRRR